MNFENIFGYFFALYREKLRCDFWRYMAKI